MICTVPLGHKNCDWVTVKTFVIANERLEHYMASKQMGEQLNEPLSKYYKAQERLEC